MVPPLSGSKINKKYMPSTKLASLFYTLKMEAVPYLKCRCDSTELQAVISQKIEFIKDIMYFF
jgi:hypothetical protein